MEVIQCLENFGGPSDPVAFQYSHIIYRKDSRIYQAFSKKRYASKSEVNINDLYNTNLVPTEALNPKFEGSFTEVREPSRLYIKRPRLSDYNHDYPCQIKDQILEEVKVCEKLRENPHPNIARYHGCEVQDGRITGLCFTKYGPTLMEKVNPKKHSKRMFSLDKDGTISTEARSWLDGIERGIRHLHSLGIIHNDINPSNIMFDGNTPVIIDFDSCRPEGYDLSMVKRTYEWHDDNVKEAGPENDFTALQEVKLWLAGEANNAFQF